MSAQGVTPTTGPASRSRRSPRHIHSPRVRRLAFEHGVDLAAIDGSGPNGRVTPADVARTSRDARSARGGLRGVPAAHAVQAALGTPAASFPLAGLGMALVEADVTPMVAPRLSPAFPARLALAVLTSLQSHPALAGASGGLDLAIAFDTPSGLVTPVLREAGSYSLTGLERQLGILADRVRAGQIGPEDLTGAGFTLAWPTDGGVRAEVMPPAPGRRAALGAGTAAERPAVIKGPDGRPAIAIRWLVCLALTFDQRLVRGSEAARFLLAVKARLESPLAGE